ncbi:MAG: Gfo/Idh/MocA family oxidoreductase, partial [Bryobacterales bacterium]|nr:Gfo/Idh/MocA family oxidoreductase [Bryobacterales bacterium]
MNRKHFLMAAAAASTAVRRSALASPNDTIRVACVGFHAQGQVHINAFLKIPNVEIAALCDVDDAVMEKGMKMVEAAGKKRPTAYADLRKLLEDKSIDAISIATPNFHHTLQTIWACQAGKDVYVEKPCSYNMFEAKQ